MPHASGTMSWDATGCVAASCCNEYCDLTGATPCSGAAMGQECIAWDDTGQAPPGYEDVGYCGLP
ncbi:MAG TPA: hypothetical protein VFG69_01795 [Nannocystaceae bacterium]|nr:hypothetical protein [Nannocystaceae bacterium]